MMIDPPNGWRYGFPKPMPSNIKNVKKWLIENGYPKELIDSYGKHFYYRYWNEDDKKKNTK